jgi:hypothetical protein
MYSRLNQHLYTDNILVPEQYDFRKGMSTDDAAFRLTDSVLNSLNQKLHVGGNFVIYQRLLTASITKFCYLNCIFMAFKEQL